MIVIITLVIINDNIMITAITSIIIMIKLIIVTTLMVTLISIDNDSKQYHKQWEL